MKRLELIAYTTNFVSFLLDSKIGKDIDKIILFGSVARGDFRKESDIDVFIDSRKEIEEEVYRILKLFQISQIQKIWELKGLKQEISVKVGELKKWTLRREIISSGMILYGKYNETPEKMNYYLMINMEMKKFKQAEQMRIWRRLYGYKQKVGKKIYTKKGLIEDVGGKKLGKSIVIVPMGNRRTILDLLDKNKVKYIVNELWSDSL